MMISQRDNFGQKQCLRDNTLFGKSQFHALHHKAFMGRMLVNNGQPILGFGNNISFMKLGKRCTKQMLSMRHVSIILRAIKRQTPRRNSVII